MFKYTQAFSSFTINNLEKAKEFYSHSLGLAVTEKPMGLLELQIEGTKVLLYVKENHEAATFTVLNFMVTHIENTVAELTKLGIVFEKYQTPHLKTDEKGISRIDGSPTIAWFKDPANNIISIIEIESKIS